MIQTGLCKKMKKILLEILMCSKGFLKIQLFHRYFWRILPKNSRTITKKSTPFSHTCLKFVDYNIYNKDYIFSFLYHYELGAINLYLEGAAISNLLCKIIKRWKQAKSQLTIFFICLYSLSLAFNDMNNT